MGKLWVQLQLGLVLKLRAEFVFGWGPGTGPGHGDRGGSSGSRASDLLEDRLRQASGFAGDNALWIHGYLHDFSTDEAFNLVVGVAAGDVTPRTVQGQLRPTSSDGSGAFTGRGEVLQGGQKEGGDNVHTFRHGPTRTPVRVPPRAQCFRSSAALCVLTVDKA